MSDEVTERVAIKDLPNQDEFSRGIGSAETSPGTSNDS